MSYTMKKTDFIRECFYAVLSDGKPHRFGEILVYTQEQSKGTPFEGEIDNSIGQAFNMIIGYPDSEYERVRHGVYQKRSPNMEKICTPSVEIPHTTSHDDSTLYSILDSACTLIDRMHEVFALQCEKMPEEKELFKPDYEKAAKSLDESIGSIGSWIAHMEDIQNGMEGAKAERTTEDMEEPGEEVPVMQM